LDYYLSYLIFEAQVSFLLNLYTPLSAVAILSNSVGSCDDRNFESAAKTEKMMKLPVIRHLAKKPSCLKEVK
jgi:Mitochondrial PGP phosphatase